MNERHVDQGARLTSFADEVMVVCIQCGAPGVVHANWVPYQWIARFECQQCHLVLSSERKQWVGPVRLSGRQPCGYCGRKWLTPSADYASLQDDIPAELEASCPDCGRTTRVKATLEKLIPDDRCCDPHFGLPLRLATGTRHGVLWAYNHRHLSALSDYVSAKLRVRRNAGNSAMFSRLPKWMKLARHRDEIAKALRKLGDID